MPGKRMATPKRVIRGGRPSMPKRLPSRPAMSVPQRPAMSVPRRGANVQRQVARTVKRQEVRQQVKKISAVPRPSVRPVSPPKKMMARPVQAAARPMSGRPSRMVRPSSRAIKRGSSLLGTQAPVSTAGRVLQAAGTAAAIGQLMRLNTSAAPAEFSYQVNSLQSSLDDLETSASMTEVSADIANLDANLNHALSLLESARDKGYKYQPDLEDIAFDAMKRWQDIRDNVEASIETQARQASNLLPGVNQSISRLNAVISNRNQAQSAIASVEGQVNQALSTIQSAERTIEAAYDKIEQQASQLTSRLTYIHWMLTQRDEASFPLANSEELFMAVKARWDQEGDTDPEGILFLTNQRLIFERKEKVATKKVLFVTTASELQQQVMGSQPLKEIKNIKAQSKGLFGHQDFLEVDFGKQVVPFHLSGQGSKDWANWIKDAQSGKIDKERATGTKLSFSDLTGKLTQADILEIQQEVNELQDEMMLKATQQELASLENQTGEITRELKRLRASGYMVEKSLEADIEVLAMQWDKIKERAQATLQFQSQQLGAQMRTIQTETAKLAGMAGALATARPVYINLKSLVSSAEAQAEAAEDTVLDQYDEYAEEVEALDAHLEWVDWMLDALSTASFKLLATESGVAAVEAIWGRAGMEPENGILFLTDQRLLWEDRVGDFELKLNVPLSEVKDAKVKTDEETGQQWLAVTFGANAPDPSAQFSLSLPVAEEWLQMIGRARSGEYASDRAVEIDQADLDRIKNAPTQCSNCGAAFTAPVLRGQTEIVCEFCGVSTRI